MDYEILDVDTIVTVPKEVPLTVNFGPTVGKAKLYKDKNGNLCCHAEVSDDAVIEALSDLNFRYSIADSNY